jgi:LPS-assembly lipoprotein
MKLCVKAGLLLLSMTWLLSACGFHLRGTTELDSLTFQSISIDPDAPFTPIQKILRMTLQGEKVRVVSATAHPDIALFLLNESVSQQALAINRTAEVEQYLLRYVLTFKILDNVGNTLLGPTTITEEREIAHDPNQTLAQNYEQAKLEAEMRRSAVQELLRRLTIVTQPHQTVRAHESTP